MKGAAEYRRLLEPQEVELGDFIFIVRGLSNAGHAKIMGGLPSVVSVSGDGEPPTKEEIDRHNKWTREVFDHCVLGIKNPETGEPELIEFDEVISPAHVNALIENATTRGLTGPKANAIRGAL